MKRSIYLFVVVSVIATLVSCAGSPGPKSSGAAEPDDPAPEAPDAVTDEVPDEDPPPTFSLIGPNGEVITEVAATQPIYASAANLVPNSEYYIDLYLSDGTRVGERLRLSTDNSGDIPATVLAYDLGFDANGGSARRPARLNIAQLTGATLSVSINNAIPPAPESLTGRVYVAPLAATDPAEVSAPTAATVGVSEYIGLDDAQNLASVLEEAVIGQDGFFDGSAREPGIYHLAINAGGNGVHGAADRVTVNGYGGTEDTGGHVVQGDRNGASAWFNVTIDGVNFCHGDTMWLTITGELPATGYGPFVVDFVNRHDFSLLGTSAQFNVTGAGPFAVVIDHVIPDAWPATNSQPGADYYAMVRPAASPAGPSSAYPRNWDNFNILCDAQEDGVGDPVLEVEVPVVTDTPYIYSSNAEGAGVNSFAAAAGHVYATAANLDPGTAVDVYVVYHNDVYSNFMKLDDISDTGPETVVVNAEGGFTKKVWTYIDGGVAPYDIVLDANQDGYWNPGEIMDGGSVVGFMLQGVHDPGTDIQVQIASNYERQYADLFYSEGVYSYLNPNIRSLTKTKWVAKYVTEHKKVWNQGDRLRDVSGTDEWDGLQGGCSNEGRVLVWSPGLVQLGSYDLIIDANKNGVYDRGIDFLDNIDTIGAPTGGFHIASEIDTDGDGVVDAIDPFPSDPSEWKDSDEDGVGANSDCNDLNDELQDFCADSCNAEHCFGHMVSLAGGCFDMGDSFNEGEADERPVHNVCVSAYEIDAYEVTVIEYNYCRNAGVCPPIQYGQGDVDHYIGHYLFNNHPMLGVDFETAETYCAWAGKRLPTEAEWEFAARGGLDGQRFHNGNSISCNQANYYYTASSYDTTAGGLGCVPLPTKVGTHPPNGYGIYDILGNAPEIVADFYQWDYYAQSPQNDPAGPEQGERHVVRGGGWFSPADDIRITDRFPFPFEPEDFDDVSYSDDWAIGIRCAR